MDTEDLEEVYAPGLGLSLYFNPRTDFLGKGTVGEVFRATTEQVCSQLHPRQKTLLIPLSRKLTSRPRQSVMPLKGFSTVESVRISPESVKS